MPWTLTYETPKNPNLLDGYLLIVGKALCLSSNFEQKCKDIVRIIKVVEAHQNNQHLEEIFNSNKSILGLNIRIICREFEIPNEYRETLEQARNSRNYIAHEAATLGEIYSASEKTLNSKIESISEHIVALAKGDNLISAWSYEIDEKEPAPSGIQEGYVAAILKWVFG